MAHSEIFVNETLVEPRDGQGSTVAFGRKYIRRVILVNPKRVADVTEGGLS